MFVLHLLILAVLHVANSADPCIPDRVENLELHLDYVLRWEESTNCENTTYYIFVSNVNQGEIFNFESDGPFLDVSHLPYCERFWFRVEAVSNNVISPINLMVAQVPPEPGTNFTVTDIHASMQTENRIFIQWNLSTQYVHCVRYFRVVRWDGETVPVDVYAFDVNIAFEDLAPCTRFEFTVTPIYNTDMEGGIGFITYETPAHSLHLPTLLDVRPGTTYVDMTWELPPYQNNRCTINSFVVDGSPFSTNLTIPITDSVSRPSIPIHVDSLQPDKMYLFRVSVVNIAGPSNPLTIGIQTLPVTEVSN